MRAALCVAFLVNLCAFPFTNGLLPYIASEIFHTDQTGLGYLSASFAFGSLIGSITLSLTSGVRIARLMIGATLSWYALLLVFVALAGPALAQESDFTYGLVLLGPRNDHGWSQSHAEAAAYANARSPGANVIEFESLNPADAPHTGVIKRARR